jgi:hypothetical protein
MLSLDNAFSEQDVIGQAIHSRCAASRYRAAAMSLSLNSLYASSYRSKPTKV